MEAGGQPPVPGGFPPVAPKPGEEGEGHVNEPQAEQPQRQSPLGAQADTGDPFAEHPEVYVGAAFAGGFAIAKILGRLGR